MLFLQIAATTGRRRSWLCSTSRLYFEPYYNAYSLLCRSPSTMWYRRWIALIWTVMMHSIWNIASCLTEYLDFLSLLPFFSLMSSSTSFPSNIHSIHLSLLSLLLIAVSSCHSSFLWSLQRLCVPQSHPLCIWSDRWQHRADRGVTLP